MKEQRNVIDDYLSNKENHPQIESFLVRVATTAAVLGAVQTVYQIGTMVNSESPDKNPESELNNTINQ